MADRIPRRLVAAAGVATSVAALLMLAPLAAFAAEATDGSDIGITVTTTPAPSPSTGGSAAGSGSGAVSGSSSTARPSSGTSSLASRAADTTVSTPDGEVQQAAGGAAPVDEVGVPGIVYVSGLNTRDVVSLNPFDGAIETTFTVRNASTETYDVDAVMWLDGPFGNDLSGRVPIAVDAVAPGETRAVRAQLNGVGQWGFVTAHVTVTPPGNVGGVAVSPITREAGVFAAPWFLALALFLGALGFITVRIVSWASRPVTVETA